MTVLLDTHVFLWWLCDSPQLSETARCIMTDGDNRLLWSVASSWEVGVKVSLGRIRFPGPAALYLPEKLAEQHVDTLPVENVHALKVAELPPHHRDLFDRLLLSQALCEGIPILSDDPLLQPYGVEILW